MGTKPNNPPFTFIDLFAGIGGMRKGAEQQGGECVFSSEFDPYARETYKENFGDYPSGDITKISETDIPDHDILMGGFPCQPFSSAGKKRGFEDPTKGNLFFDVMRIITAKKPKVVILENVRGLTSHDEGRTEKVVLQSLRDSGYTPHTEIMKSVEFGVPQTRERWYCVAFRDIHHIPYAFPSGTNRDTTIEDIIDESANNDPSLRLSPLLMGRVKHHFDNCETTKRVKHTSINHKPNSARGRAGVYSHQQSDGAIRFHRGGEQRIGLQEIYFCCDSSTAPTLTTSHTTKLWDRGRILSVRECARLQGFDDNFVFPVSKTQAIKQLGNSVTVPVVNAIVESVLGFLNDGQKADPRFSNPFL